MKNLLENTTDSIWAVDRDYHILYLNNAFRVDLLKVFGVELKEGDRILDKLPKEIYSYWKNKYDKAFDGNRFSFEDSFSDKENNVVYVQVSLSPIIFNNEITGVTCSGRDITKNKLNEIELQKYSVLLKSSLESQKDTILLSIDNKFNYMYFNSAHFEVMKYAYDVEIENGMNILDCITDIDDRNAACLNYTRALNGESHSNIRIYGDKNKEYYESFFNPIRNENFEIVGATAMARSITNRVKQDEALIESEKSLKEANITKDKFFSLISHDLRSPISSITYLANTILENFDDYNPAQIKLYLNSICKGLNSSYSLLEDLLLWSRTQNNSIEFNPEKINLSELTSDVIEIFFQNIESKELEIIKNFPPTFDIYADKKMVSTIIRNLISNAVKFSYNRGKIEIKFEKSIDNVIISIRDSGIGISNENLSKIFSLGESISTPGTNNEKGTGIGLILCKEFVEKHKGDITIESKLNVGTNVKVFLKNKL